MFKISIIVILIISILICEEVSGELNETHSGIVPVLIWGPKLKQPSALQKLTAEELHSIINPVFNSHQVVVFLEKQLNMRDFLSYKSNATVLPAPYMASRENKTFFNSVINPIKLFKTPTFSKELNGIKQQHDMALYGRNCLVGTKHIFTFNDAIDGHNKTKIIQNHDRIIADIGKGLENCSTMYIYTGYTSSSSSCSGKRNKRSRRSPQDDDAPTAPADPDQPAEPDEPADPAEPDEPAEPAEPAGPAEPAEPAGPTESDGPGQPAAKLANSSYFEIYDANIKIRWKQLIHIYGTRRNRLTFTKIKATTDLTHTDILLNSADHIVQIFVVIEHGSYVMRFINLDDKNYWMHDVGAPLYASYKCKKLYATSDPQNKIIWKDLQFQLFDEFLNGTTKKTFSPAWNCIGFITIPILSGIFIAILIVSITAIGITWIMNINNMDRFDDPKGKNIIIPS